MTGRRIAALAALALLSVSCAGDGDATSPQASTPPSTGTGSTTTTTLVPPTPTDPPEIPRPVIGDLDLPCGTVDDVELDPGPGVDDESIVIGTGNDRGGLATFDAGRGLTEAVAALADHCNGLGGLAAREIVVVDFDAAGVETAERIVEACAQVHAMVGFRYLEGLLAAATAAECALPLVPAPASSLGTQVRLHGHLAALFGAPLEAGSVALVGPDTVSGVLARQQRAAALVGDGSPFPLTVTADLGYPVDVPPDWSGIVGAVRFSGAGAVHIDGGCEHAVVPFLRTAREAGWDPVVVATVSAYDDACLADPELVTRLLVELPILPFEDGEAAPATLIHQEILSLTGAPLTGDALLAASAFWKWAVAVDRCGSALDRACVDRQAGLVDNWTAGGLHPAVGADGSAEPCAIVLGAPEGEWTRLLPTEPGTYECNPDWAVAP